jgi:hypothetical protein
MKYLECGLNDNDLYIFTGDYTGNTGVYTGNNVDYTGSAGDYAGNAGESTENCGEFNKGTGKYNGSTEDYTGSGAENTEVIKFLISIMCRDNVILLEGDHEKCFCNLATGEEQRKISEFEDSLQISGISPEGITKRCIIDLYRRMEPCICYNFLNKYVLVTHGGLSSLPENLIFVGSAQMVNGVGEPKDAGVIAESFNRNTNENTYQVHGHRNPENLPIENGRTFNLCCESENGGLLRILTLDRQGFHSQVIEK